MRPCFGPLHLLFFAEALAHHLVHWRLHTQKGNDMSIRRGWQATVGALDAVLRHRDGAQGADAQVRDGQRLERASLPDAYEAGTTNTGVWPARMTRSVTLPRKKRLKPL